MLIFKQKRTLYVHIHEALTLASFFCSMSSVINRYKMWLNVAIENKDVLGASQNIN